MLDELDELDELVGGGALAVLLEVLDVDVDVDVVAGAAVEALADEEAAAIEVELEWPLDPHATTNSAAGSAAPIRFSIGRG